MTTKIKRNGYGSNDYLNIVKRPYWKFRLENKEFNDRALKMIALKSILEKMVYSKLIVPEFAMDPCDMHIRDFDKYYVELEEEYLKVNALLFKSMNPIPRVRKVTSPVIEDEKLNNIKPREEKLTIENRPIEQSIDIPEEKKEVPDSSDKNLPNKNKFLIDPKSIQSMYQPNVKFENEEVTKSPYEISEHSNELEDEKNKQKEKLALEKSESIAILPPEVKESSPAKVEESVKLEKEINFDKKTTEPAITSHMEAKPKEVDLKDGPSYVISQNETSPEPLISSPRTKKTKKEQSKSPKKNSKRF